MDSISEQAIQQRIRIGLSRGETRLFRNNTGALKDQNGRLVHFGLCKGSPDLVGFRSVKITPEMVGQTVAVFTAIEVKTPKGKPTPLQERFLKVVQDFGGIAGIARSLEQAKYIVYSQDCLHKWPIDPFKDRS
tara:strand:+ start:653 stop:1051 length:399 start_codon:yes stop_codon:yes gene_type:complete